MMIDYRKSLIMCCVLAFCSACGMKTSDEGKVYAIAEEIAGNLDDTSRDIIVETPMEMRSRLIGMDSFIAINNAFGIREKSATGREIRAECAKLAPGYLESEIPEICIDIIIEKVFDIVFSEANKEMVERLDNQISLIRSLEIGSKRDRFSERMHLIEVIDLLNTILNDYGSSITIEVDNSLIDRPRNWGGLSEWEPVVTGFDRYPPSNVLEALHFVVWRLDACFRQRPGLIWLGDDCTDFNRT